MSQNRYILLSALVVSLLLAILGGLLWANASFVHSAGRSAEFLTLWSGARGILMEGVSPYSEQTTLATQRLVYGRAARPGQAALSSDVPLYIQVLLLPIGAVADPDQAQAIWMTALEAALAGSTLLCLRVLRWKVPLALLAALLLFGIFWAYGFLALFQGGLAILTLLLITGIISALDAGIDELAGALIFLATFQLEAGLPFLVFIMIWTLAQRRYRVLAGLGMTAVVLIAVSLLLFADWPWPFLRATLSNLRTGSLFTPASILEIRWPGIGRGLGRWLTVLFAIVLVLEWRSARSRDFRAMLWTASLSIAVAPLLGFPTSPLNFVTLFFALMYFLFALERRLPQPGAWAVGGSLAVMFAGLWLLLIARGPASAWMLLLFPAALVVGLYWVRWWMIKTPRTWIEEINRETG